MSEPQTFQFTIEWRAGDKPYSIEEISELLENGLGMDGYDNKITDVRQVSHD